jgi:hypothetical protein
LPCSCFTEAVHNMQQFNNLFLSWKYYFCNFQSMHTVCDIHGHNSTFHPIFPLMPLTGNLLLYYNILEYNQTSTKIDNCYLTRNQQEKRLWHDHSPSCHYVKKYKTQSKSVPNIKSADLFQ